MRDANALDELQDASCPVREDGAAGGGGAPPDGGGAADLLASSWLFRNEEEPAAGEPVAEHHSSRLFREDAEAPERDAPAADPVVAPADWPTPTGAELCEPDSTAITEPICVLAPESLFEVPRPAVVGAPPRSARVERAAAAVVAAAGALAALGVVMTYSSSAVLAERFGSPTVFLVRQAAWVAAGAFALLAGSRLDYHLVVRLRRPILLAALVLLALVFVPGVGARLNGARRWLRLAGLGVQPSEFAKIAIVTYLAGFLAWRRDAFADWRRGFLPAAMATGAVAGLVVVEPDVGTAVLIAAVGGALMLVGGVRFRHVLPAAAVAAPVGACYVLARFQYVADRLMAFWDPSVDPLGRGYHARQSLIAFASGGVFGLGPGASVQKLGFLPEAHTDFVLSVVGEELGLAGALGVVACFAVLALALRRIALSAPDAEGTLLATGVGLWIALQAAFNVAVVTVSVPTKGIPLPLVSYGGSSLVATAFALGLALNVAGHVSDPPRRGIGGFAETWRERPLEAPVAFAGTADAGWDALWSGPDGTGGTR